MCGIAWSGSAKDCDKDNLLYAHQCVVKSGGSESCYLCEEYTHRYGKVHETERKLLSVLALAPEKIPKSLEVTKMPLAMGAEPQCINEDDVIGSYRNYYMTKQRRFKMTWKNRPVPEWFHYDSQN